MLTYKSALIADIGFMVPDELIEKALLDNDLVAEDGYSKEFQLVLDAATLDVLVKVRHLSSIKEGSFAVTIDTKALQAHINMLARRLGKFDLLEEFKQPVIRARNIW